MRLTSFSDYSLRVLMYLALRPERRATIGEIAAAYRISENHLMKIAHFLGKEKLLTNVRGNGGGLELSRRPKAINLGEVVRITEMNSPPVECFDPQNNACVITPRCALKGVLAEAVNAFYAVLSRYTLADVVGNREQLEKILFLRHEPNVASRAH